MCSKHFKKSTLPGMVASNVILIICVGPIKHITLNIKYVTERLLYCDLRYYDIPTSDTKGINTTIKASIFRQTRVPTPTHFAHEELTCEMT